MKLARRSPFPPSKRQFETPFRVKWFVLICLILTKCESGYTGAQHQFVLGAFASKEDMDMTTKTETVMNIALENCASTPSLCKKMDGVFSLRKRRGQLLYFVVCCGMISCVVFCVQYGRTDYGKAQKERNILECLH